MFRRSVLLLGLAWSLMPAMPLWVEAAPKAPVILAEAPLPSAKLMVESSENANWPSRSVLKTGVPLITGRGGSAIASSIDFGLKSVTLKENSSASVRESGRAAYGGRTLKIDIKGAGRVETRYLISRSSYVAVCLFGKGCVELRSTAKIKPISGNRYVIGLIEGKGRAQDLLETQPAVELAANQFTIMDQDGKFTPAQNVRGTKGYRTIKVTKTLQRVEALDGFDLRVGKSVVREAILPIGVPITTISPLD